MIGRYANSLCATFSSLDASRNRGSSAAIPLDCLSSDAYATGQALYALSFADVKNDRLEIQRAISFLAASQRDDGSWPMISRGHPRVEHYTNLVPITYFGSAWATLGLAWSVSPSRRDAGQ